MINESGLLLEQHYESLHDGDLTKIGLQPKMDPVGIWTEGWGHAIVDDKGNFIKGIANKALAYKFSKIQTVEQADAFLQIDNSTAELWIHRNLTVKVSDNLYAALVAHTMNTGGSHDLLQLVNKKLPIDVIFGWWTKHYTTGQGNPKPLPGLISRRKTEATLGLFDKLEFYN